MISPEEIRERARRLWMSGRVLRAHLGAEALFPYGVPFAKPTAREWLDRYGELRAGVERLAAESKAQRGAGYAVEYREVAHQKLGRIRVPDSVVFQTAEDAAACAGEIRALQRFGALAALVRLREPRLVTWLAERPLRALEHEGAIPKLLNVVAYFEAHPRPMRFARELGIAGIDSKFIGAYQGVLAEWLDRVLPAGAVDETVRGLSDYGFERRYGLRYEEALVRFRWLDASRALGGRIADASVPLSQLAAYAPPCTRVFVTENKINFLTLPQSDAALAIFGSGYAIDRLRHIEWLHRTAVHYWGDIDTHGFAILNRLRARLPHVRSFLMDRDTLLAHREQWSEEPLDGRHMQDLPALTEDELQLFDDLRRDRLGVRVRLEQERVGYECVKGAVTGTQACSTT